MAFRNGAVRHPVKTVLRKDNMDEEIKKAIADAVAEATKALKDKNAELIGEVRTLKADKQAAQDAAEEAANEAATKAGDVEAIKTALEKKHKTEIDKLTKSLSERDTKLGELLIDNSIKQAISANNVLPHFVPAVEAMLRAGVRIENGEAFAADGSTLEDAKAAFFKSDAAKHFIAAPINSGAGATGSTTPAGAGHGFTKDNIRAREAEWMMMEKTDPAMFKQIAIDTGRTDVL